MIDTVRWRPPYDPCGEISIINNSLHQYLAS